MKTLTGVNTLLMTPFSESGAIDLGGIYRQIDRVLEAGVTSVVVQGKIGEYDTYTMDERRDTARAVVEYVAGRVPVGVGIINAEFDYGLQVGEVAVLKLSFHVGQGAVGADQLANVLFSDRTR